MRAPLQQIPAVLFVAVNPGWGLRTPVSRGPVHGHCPEHHNHCHAFAQCRCLSQYRQKKLCLQSQRPFKQQADAARRLSNPQQHSGSVCRGSVGVNQKAVNINGPDVWQLPLRRGAQCYHEPFGTRSQSPCCFQREAKLCWLPACWAWDLGSAPPAAPGRRRRVGREECIHQACLLSKPGW